MIILLYVFDHSHMENSLSVTKPEKIIISNVKACFVHTEFSYP